MIDVGGESTRPGSDPVSTDEEIRRVIPVVSALAEAGIRVSIDTSKPSVAAEAVAAGAKAINDVTGFTNPSMREVAAAAGVSVCVMHMQGTPRSMQGAPSYTDVVEEVMAFLMAQARTLLDAGVHESAIWLDPGIGFGKNREHNIALLRGLPKLCSLGYPVLVGVSRKSFISLIAPGAPGPESRLAGSLAAALFAASNGARILRVHDVPETVQALALRDALA
jgi:dihydropteroate synthase